jgi:glycosyltransferase involved in cell wall biosynthesis
MTSAVAGIVLRPASKSSSSISPEIAPNRGPSIDPIGPKRQPSVCVIIPAHNEQSRVSAVLRAVLDSNIAYKVIVVNDGSTDHTADVVREFEPEVMLLNLNPNRGKGGAMLAGADAASDADVLLFLDGDLQNLAPAHVAALARPVMQGDADMAIGQFRGGRGLTDLAQLLVPYISGQRAIRRDLFLSIPGLGEVGYGIEMAITLNVKRMRGKVRSVTIRGVTHPMKEEKLGLLKGGFSRCKMYAQMLRFTISYLIHKH